MQSVHVRKIDALDYLSQSIFQLFWTVYYPNASFSAQFLSRNSPWIAEIRGYHVWKGVISSVQSSNVAAYPRFRGRQGVKGEQAIPYQPCIRMQPGWRSEVLARPNSLAFAGSSPQSPATGRGSTNRPTREATSYHANFYLRSKSALEMATRSTGIAV